jgi:hypothetical protein
MKNNEKYLSEDRCLWAIKNTKSNRAAAEFLNVNPRTWFKYSSRYIDIESGKNLFELHKNMAGKGCKKSISRYRNDISKLKYNISDILEGKIKNLYNRNKMLSILINYNIMPQRCSECGFNDRRATDQRMPIYLDYINGNEEDGRIENIRILCHNCYFLYVGNTHGPNSRYYSIEQGDSELDNKNMS